MAKSVAPTPQSNSKTLIAPPLVKKSVTFNRNLGRNAPDLIANLVVSGTIPALEELIANAYDADATRVNLEYRPELDALLLKDNGSGMTAENGLESFYRLGDSPKIKEPVSAAGRTRIGKFGVATILLRSLCDSYKLTTIQDGRKTIIHERLEERVSSDKPITGREVSIESDAHGTALLLKGLKFTEGDNFSLAELKRRIQWDLPLLPDFQVYVNGEAVQSKQIESATIFKIDTDGKHMGSIKGNLYLTNKKALMTGVHVYVNGRKIGDPKTFLRQDRLSMRDRIVGIVHADNLEEAILFDRGRFREDHPGVVELGKTLAKAAGVIEQYTRDTSERSMVNKVQGQRGRITQKAVSQLVRAKVEGIDKNTSVEFSDDIDPIVPGRHYPDTNTIYLNNKHPSLVPTSVTTIPRYEQAVIGAVIDALALEETERGKSPLQEFLKRRGELWEQLQATSERETAKGEIHPMVMYQLSDLGRLSTKGLGVMRYLAEGEVFPMHEEGVLGRDFLEAQRAMHGFATLYEIVHDKLSEQNGNSRSPTNLTTVMERFHAILDKAGKKSEPFVYRADDKAPRPAYVVEQMCADRVYSLLRSPAVDMRRSDANPEQVFSDAYNEAYTIPELARTAGIKIDEVTKVLGLAKQRGLNIAINTKSTPVRFRFGDFVRVYQIGRKEAYERSTKS